MPRASLVLSACAACAAGALALFACKNNASHIYLGEQYDLARSCIDPTSSLDIVEGDDPGQSCAVKCLVAPADQDGGRTIYVSQMCPPYPPLFDTGGAFPGCDGAIAAYQRKDVCLADGGSTSPSDAAASDAASDAGGGDAGAMEAGGD